MSHSRRICHPIGSQPNLRNLRLHPKHVPWVCLILIALAIFVIFSLWGKLPKKAWFPHHAPVAVFPSLFAS